MNIEDTKKAIQVMQAYVDGKEIVEGSDNIINSPCWDWLNFTYQIKPIKPRIGNMMIGSHPKGIELTPEVCEALEKAGIEYD